MKIGHLIKKYKFPILLTLFTRLGYSLWLLLIWLAVDRHIQFTPTALLETYNRLAPSNTLIGRALIDVWLRWDAVHYMNIAEFGYRGVSPGDTVFFPLYPYLTGVLSGITSVNVTLMGILVSSFAALFAMICLYELVLTLFGDENLAKASVLLLAIYPAAFFLHAPFTDALFLLCSIACILMMVKQKSLMSGLFACIAGLARPQGVLLLLPMAVFYIRRHGSDKKFFQWREILALLIAPLGFLGYSIWRRQFGLAGMFQSLQEYSSVRFQDPLTTLFKTFAGLIHKPDIVMAAELLSVLFFLALLIWMFIRKEFRQHLEIMLYSAATWLLITSKTTIAGDPLQSANRYVLHIFFAFVGMAAIWQTLPQRFRRLVPLVFIIMGLICSAAYSFWIFIG